MCFKQTMKILFKIPADDRRFTGIYCNSQYANNKIYFTHLYKEINSSEYTGVYYDNFMNIDLTNFDLKKKDLKLIFIMILEN